MEMWPVFSKRCTSSFFARSGRTDPPSSMRVVGRLGDRQHRADRLDPVDGSVLVDEGHIASVGGRAPPVRNTPTPCEDLVRALEFSILALELLHAFSLRSRQARSFTGIALRLPHPAAQRLLRASDLRCDRRDGRPTATRAPPPAHAPAARPSREPPASACSVSPLAPSSQPRAPRESRNQSDERIEEIGNRNSEPRPAIYSVDRSANSHRRRAGGGRRWPSSSSIRSKTITPASIVRVPSTRTRRASPRRPTLRSPPRLDRSSADVRARARHASPASRPHQHQRDHRACGDGSHRNGMGKTGHSARAP